jgi:hypothetical protein
VRPTPKAWNKIVTQSGSESDKRFQLVSVREGSSSSKRARGERPGADGQTHGVIEGVTTG